MGIEAGLTPAAHVRELLARAQNPFDVTDAVLARLDAAVLYQVELHGWRQRRTPSPGLRCSSYRHVFLLRDGTLLHLWELRHGGAHGGAARTLHEVYESEEALVRSERRVLQAHQAHATSPCRDLPHPGTAGGEPGGTAGDTTARQVPVEYVLMTNPPFGRRTYSGSGSPDHARRLLRRAENADSPGEEVSRLLATACGHQILPVPRPRALAQEWQVWCCLYEHAFLLADGSELSLYELEHDLSRTGALVCEVYADAATADRAADRLVRDHGVGP